MTAPRPLAVKLIGKPAHPLATLWYVWEQSRTNASLPLPEEVQVVLDSRMDRYPITTDEGRIAASLGGAYAGGIPDNEIDVSTVRTRLWDTVTKLIDEDIPCTENLDFVFALENVPISLREQLVRHRIGVTIGERTGVDIVPEIEKSSWWSQTMRMLPMDRFYSEGRYILPDSIAGNVTITPKDHLPGCSVEDRYLSLLEETERTYNLLIEAGVPMEDARQLIPLAATHGLTWKINLKALAHVLGKRACWVAQVNLWEGVISGMVNALCDEIHPIFRKLIAPPCMKAGKYHGCPYFAINEERVQGRDHMPPCPMWVYNETDSAMRAFREHEEKTTWSPPLAYGDLEYIPQTDIAQWNCSEPVEREMLLDGVKRFEKLWKFNVRTGAPL